MLIYAELPGSGPFGCLGGRPRFGAFGAALGAVPWDILGQDVSPLFNTYHPLTSRHHVITSSRHQLHKESERSKEDHIHSISPTSTSVLIIFIQLFKPSLPFSFHSLSSCGQHELPELLNPSWRPSWTPGRIALIPPAPCRNLGEIWEAHEIS